MSKTWLAKLLALLMAFGLVASACGGDDDSEETDAGASDEETTDDEAEDDETTDDESEGDEPADEDAMDEDESEGGPTPFGAPFPSFWRLAGQSTERRVAEKQQR